VAMRVSRRAGAAVHSLWARAGPSIRAVGLDLGVARQLAVFPLVGGISTILYSASSTS
jgi:hypothetical protein